jgi:hypothetical protein
VDDLPSPVWLLDLAPRFKPFLSEQNTLELAQKCRLLKSDSKSENGLWPCRRPTTDAKPLSIMRAIVAKEKNSNADYTLRTFYRECGMRPTTIDRAIETRYADSRKVRSDLGVRKLSRGRKSSMERKTKQLSVTHKKKVRC